MRDALVLKCLAGLLLLVTSCGRVSTEKDDRSYALAVSVEKDSGDRGVLLINVGSDEIVDFTASHPDVTPYGSWSPDGNEYTFLSKGDGPPDILSMDMTGNVVNLTQNPARDVGGVWSPDGQFIAFRSTRGYCPTDETAPEEDCVWAGYDLYVMKRDGSNLRRITEDGFRECCIEWWPDGSGFVYSANDDLSDEIPTEIYAVNVGEWIPVQLTDSSDVSVSWLYAYNVAPKPSPDGQYVLFNSCRDDDDELYLMAPDGSEQVRLTDTPDGHEFHASWSPDGSFIAWSHDNRQILVMNVETKDIIDTGTEELKGCLPLWSPSGKQIAFVAGCGPGGPDSAVYVMNHDGTDKVSLTAHLGYQHYSLRAWVPIEWMESSD